MNLGALLAAAIGFAGVTESVAGITMGRVEVFSGYHAQDYSTVDQKLPLFSGGQFDVWCGGAEGWGGQLDLMAGRYATSEWVGLAGAQVWRRGAAGLLGFGFVHTELEGGIRSEQIRLDGEVYEDDLVDLVAGVGWESKNFGDDIGFGEIYLRLHPTERLDLVSGFSYAPTGIKQTRADILFRADWDLARWAGKTFSVHGEFGGNLFTKASLGLVVRFDDLARLESARTRNRRLFRFR